MENRNAYIMIVAILLTFALSFLIYSNFHIAEAQGPLGKVVEKIIEGFQLKHCEWLELERTFHLKLPMTCNVDINSVSTALAEAVSTTAFVTAVLGTLLYWKKRLSYVMLGVAALLFFGVAPYKMILEHMELGLILFLISMMVIVEYLSESGVLEWITVKLTKASGFKPIPFLIMLTFLSWIMAA